MLDLLSGDICLHILLNQARVNYLVANAECKRDLSRCVEAVKPCVNFRIDLSLLDSVSFRFFHLSSKIATGLPCDSLRLEFEYPTLRQSLRRNTAPITRGSTSTGGGQTRRTSLIVTVPPLQPMVYAAERACSSHSVRVAS